MSVHVRAASFGDYQALCALFEELDEFHRRARPGSFVGSMARYGLGSRSVSGWPAPFDRAGS